MSIKIIDRETKKYWVVDERKYKKSNLQFVNKSIYSREMLMEYTKENYQEFKTYKLENYNIQRDYDCLTVNEKEEVYRLIKGFLKNKKDM